MLGYVVFHVLCIGRNVSLNVNNAARWRIGAFSQESENSSAIFYSGGEFVNYKIVRQKLKSTKKKHPYAGASIGIKKCVRRDFENVTTATRPVGPSLRRGGVQGKGCGPG